MKSTLFFFITLVFIISACNSKSGKKIENEENAPHHETVVAAKEETGYLVLYVINLPGKKDSRTGVIDTVEYRASIHPALKNKLDVAEEEIMPGDSITVIPHEDPTVTEGDYLIVGVKMKYWEASVR